MGLNNFQITLKGKQPSPRIYSEDITEIYKKVLCSASDPESLEVYG